MNEDFLARWGNEWVPVDLFENTEGKVVYLMYIPSGVSLKLDTISGDYGATYTEPDEMIPAMYTNWIGPYPEPREEYYEEPDIPGAWHEYDIWGDENGAVVYESTNDNYDYGYPSEHAHWENSFLNLEAAKEYAGVTRQGIGCSVTVKVNGEVYHGEK